MFPFLCNQLMICDQGNHIPFAFQLWIDMDDVTDFEEQGTLIRFRSYSAKNQSIDSNLEK